MLRSEDVQNKTFTSTQFRPGYDQREVYDFLDQVLETLRQYEQGGAPGAAPGGEPLPAPRAGHPPYVPPSSPTPDGGEQGFAQRATRWLRGDPPS